MPQQVTWPSAEAVLTQPKWLVAGSVVIAACVAIARSTADAARSIRLASLPLRAIFCASRGGGRGRTRRSADHEFHLAHVRQARGRLS